MRGSAPGRIWRWGLLITGGWMLAVTGQSWGYEVITVTDGGTIQGQVKVRGVAPTLTTSQH